MKPKQIRVRGTIKIVNKDGTVKHAVFTGTKEIANGDTRKRG